MIMLSCGDCCCKEILQFYKACQAVNGLDILQTILAIPNKIRMARILKCYLNLDYLSAKTIGKTNETGTTLPSSVLPGVHIGDSFTARTASSSIAGFTPLNTFTSHT